MPRTAKCVNFSRRKKPLVYESFREDKDTGAHHTPRTVYFYLVETNGEEHLAAVGEAQDESSPHTFSYKFTESFRNEEYGPSPPLYNKHNVREWLNSIISQSHLLAESGMGNFAASSSSRQYVKHDHEIVTDSTTGSKKVRFFLVDSKGKRHQVATANLLSDGQISACTPCIEAPVHAPLPECTQTEAVGRWMDEFMAITPVASEQVTEAPKDLEDDGLSSEASGLSNDAEPGSGEGSLSEQPHREHSSDQENNPDKQQAQSAVSTGGATTGPKEAAGGVLEEVQKVGGVGGTTGPSQQVTGHEVQYFTQFEKRDVIESTQPGDVQQGSRICMQWVLINQSGAEHPAVQAMQRRSGGERTYRPVGVGISHDFPDKVPWQRFTKESEVEEWLEQFLLTDTSGEEAGAGSHATSSGATPRAMHDSRSHADVVAQDTGRSMLPVTTNSMHVAETNSAKSPRPNGHQSSPDLPNCAAAVQELGINVTSLSAHAHAAGGGGGERSVTPLVHADNGMDFDPNSDPAIGEDLLERSGRSIPGIDDHDSDSDMQPSKPSNSMHTGGVGVASSGAAGTRDVNRINGLRFNSWNLFGLSQSASDDPAVPGRISSSGGVNYVSGGGVNRGRGPARGQGSYMLGGTGRWICNAARKVQDVVSGAQAHQSGQRAPQEHEEEVVEKAKDITPPCFVPARRLRRSLSRERKAQRSSAAAAAASGAAAQAAAAALRRPLQRAPRTRMLRKIAAGENEEGSGPKPVRQASESQDDFNQRLSGPSKGTRGQTKPKSAAEAAGKVADRSKIPDYPDDCMKRCSLCGEVVLKEMLSGPSYCGPCRRLIQRAGKSGISTHEVRKAMETGLDPTKLISIPKSMKNKVITQKFHPHRQVKWPDRSRTIGPAPGSHTLPSSDMHHALPATQSTMCRHADSAGTRATTRSHGTADVARSSSHMHEMHAMAQTEEALRKRGQSAAKAQAAPPPASGGAAAAGAAAATAAAQTTSAQATAAASGGAAAAAAPAVSMRAGGATVSASTTRTAAPAAAPTAARGTAPTAAAAADAAVVAAAVPPACTFTAGHAKEAANPAAEYNRAVGFQRKLRLKPAAKTAAEVHDEMNGEVNGEEGWRQLPIWKRKKEKTRKVWEAYIHATMYGHFWPLPPELAMPPVNKRRRPKGSVSSEPDPAALRTQVETEVAVNMHEKHASDAPPQAPTAPTPLKSLKRSVHDKHASQAQRENLLLYGRNEPNSTTAEDAAMHERHVSDENKNQKRSRAGTPPVYEKTPQKPSKSMSFSPGAISPNTPMLNNKLHDSELLPTPPPVDSAQKPNGESAPKEKSAEISVRKALPFQRLNALGDKSAALPNTRGASSNLYRRSQGRIAQPAAVTVAVAAAAALEVRPHEKEEQRARKAGEITRKKKDSEDMRAKLRNSDGLSVSERSKVSKNASSKSEGAKKFVFTPKIPRPGDSRTQKSASTKSAPRSRKLQQLMQSDTESDEVAPTSMKLAASQCTKAKGAAKRIGAGLYAASATSKRAATDATPTPTSAAAAAAADTIQAPASAAAATAIATGAGTSALKVKPPNAAAAVVPAAPAAPTQLVDKKSASEHSNRSEARAAKTRASHALAAQAGVQAANGVNSGVNCGGKDASKHANASKDALVPAGADLRASATEKSGFKQYTFWQHGTRAPEQFDAARACGSREELPGGGSGAVKINTPTRISNQNKKAAGLINHAAITPQHVARNSKAVALNSNSLLLPYNGAVTPQRATGSDIGAASKAKAAVVQPVNAAQAAATAAAARAARAAALLDTANKQKNGQNGQNGRNSAAAAVEKPSSKMELTASMRKKRSVPDSDLAPEKNSNSVASKIPRAGKSKSEKEIPRKRTASKATNATNGKPNGSTRYTGLQNLPVSSERLEDSNGTANADGTTNAGAAAIGDARAAAAAAPVSQKPPQAHPVCLNSTNFAGAAGAADAPATTGGAADAPATAGGAADAPATAGGAADAPATAGGAADAPATAGGAADAPATAGGAADAPATAGGAADAPATAGGAADAPATAGGAADAPATAGGAADAPATAGGAADAPATADGTANGGAVTDPVAAFDARTAVAAAEVPAAAKGGASNAQLGGEASEAADAAAKATAAEATAADAPAENDTADNSPAANGTAENTPADNAAAESKPVAADGVMEQEEEQGNHDSDDDMELAEMILREKREAMKERRKALQEASKLLAQSKNPDLSPAERQKAKVKAKQMKKHAQELLENEIQF